MAESRTSDLDDEPGPGRSIWSGTITFGLVSVPVDLFAAIRARQTSMKMVDPKGRPLGRRYYCPKEDKPLANGDIVRGFEMDNGKMVVMTDEELAAAAPEMSRDIDLRRFVPLAQIPPTYFQRPYIMAPAGKSTKAYHLLAQTMQRSARVGVGTFVMRGHEYLVAILSDGALLRAVTLRFPDELRTPADIGLPKRTKPSAALVKTFTSAVTALTRDALDVRELSDRYADELHKLAEQKEKKGEDVVATTAPSDEDETASAEVIDLVKLLKDRLSSKATVTTADALAGDEASSSRPQRRPPHAAKAAKKSITARKTAAKKTRKTA